MRQLGYESNKADPNLWMKVEEPIPPNAPEAIGKVVDLHMYVNSDYAGDQCMQRSCSGFLIYLNTALISWYPKRQSTIETCTFDAKFVAMKTGISMWNTFQI
ncbi:hypothetical protein ACHAXS_000835, partial [Conticribra weissflogii]